MTTIIILSVLYLLFIIYILYSFYLDTIFLPLGLFFISYFVFPGGYGESKVILSAILGIVGLILYVYANFWRKHIVFWQVVLINIFFSLGVVIGFALFNYYQPDLANLYEVSITAAFSNINVIFYSLIVVLLCPIIKYFVMKRRRLNKRFKLLQKRKMLAAKVAKATKVDHKTSANNTVASTTPAKTETTAQASSKK